MANRVEQIEKQERRRANLYQQIIEELDHIKKIRSPNYLNALYDPPPISDPWFKNTEIGVDQESLRLKGILDSAKSDDN